jgi:hypothetical protein
MLSMVTLLIVTTSLTTAHPSSLELDWKLEIGLLGIRGLLMAIIWKCAQYTSKHP